MNAKRIRTLRSLLLAAVCLVTSLSSMAAQPAGTGIGAVLPAKAADKPTAAAKPARRPPDELRQAPHRNRGAPEGVVAPQGKKAAPDKARKSP